MAIRIKSPAGVLHELAVLKSALLAAPYDPVSHEGGLDEVVDRFNELSYDPFFSRRSRPDPGGGLPSIVAAVTRQLIPGAKRVPELVYFRVEGSDFVHGGGPFQSGMMVSFYFETDRVGLFLHTPPDGHSLIVRLTSVELPDDVPLVSHRVGFA